MKKKTESTGDVVTLHLLFVDTSWFCSAYVLRNRYTDKTPTNDIWLRSVQHSYVVVLYVVCVNVHMLSTDWRIELRWTFYRINFILRNIRGHTKRIERAINEPHVSSMLHAIHSVNKWFLIENRLFLLLHFSLFTLFIKQ